MFTGNKRNGLYEQSLKNYDILTDNESNNERWHRKSGTGDEE